ncbi:MAG: hypothetical protein KIT80_17130 [Chitinophagaceae bacterium]|nr:hypothetical protein [Chitinophagaceae bacterium]MCW5928645.1 hypothetical protein [Chitinophagaceae bacterium]
MNKAINIIQQAPRILLGLIYLVFGLNFFLHFIPSPPPVQDNSPVSLFSGGLGVSGYFYPFLKAVEVIAGAFLIINLFSPLVTLIAFTISVHIFLFHAFLAPDTMLISVIMLLFNIYLLWAYRGLYFPLLQKPGRRNLSPAKQTA